MVINNIIGSLIIIISSSSSSSGGSGGSSSSSIVMIIMITPGLVRGASHADVQDVGDVGLRRLRPRMLKQ